MSCRSVAFFLRPSKQDGYATPLALVLTLAMGLIASAMVGRSVGQLRLARADLDRSQAEYLLDGAHLAAVAAIVRNNRMGPFAWAFTSDVGWVDAAAQLEADKLTLQAASRLDDRIFLKFGVTDPAQLRARLATAAAAQSAVDVGVLDEALLWRTCAGAMISPFGRQTTFSYVKSVEPGAGPNPASWRIGEAWRVRLTTATGWRDDRIVRFTGDARHPAAVVVRRLSRGEGDGGQCDAIFSSLAAA